MDPHAQGYHPPQQGYHPAQPGYPPPQQGYPPPSQGYPSLQQSSAPMQQAMPTQGQVRPAPEPMQTGLVSLSPQPAAMGGNALPGGVDYGGADDDDDDDDDDVNKPPPAPAPALASLFDGEVPDTDVSGDSDDNDDEPAARAISLDGMDRVEGYNMGDDFIPPPPPPTYEEATKNLWETGGELPKITDEEAREALLSHVVEQCCWGQRAARDLTLIGIEHSVAFHYTLETFSERRTTKWVHEPFVGQPVDGPQNGPAPLPWAIPVTIPALFVNNTRRLEVPHTASVKPCHNCLATGFVRCHRCLGRGRIRCRRCGGRGRRRVRRYNSRSKKHHYQNVSCSSCHGSGRRRCFTCNGDGRVVCKVCKGSTQLKCYIQLTVEWINHVEDSIVERTNLPDALVREVSGQTVFEEEHPKVCPISHFPEQDINEASYQIVSRHEVAYRNEMLHKQRHKVRVIPVAEAKCRYDERVFVFFVYGFEHKVYAPDYPMQCCWGCSIL